MEARGRDPRSCPWLSLCSGHRSRRRTWSVYRPDRNPRAPLRQDRANSRSLAKCAASCTLCPSTISRPSNRSTPPTALRPRGRISTGISSYCCFPLTPPSSSSARSFFEPFSFCLFHYYWRPGVTPFDGCRPRKSSSVSSRPPCSNRSPCCSTSSRTCLILINESLLEKKMGRI